ncbi:alpha/beta hydrolase [Amphibacillus jilinensis]|uniref:alpha/beta hydrolase n=1 Tax=Amphibacillus jilinensis TaxID=1216008 RepID=UPI0003034B50|nr:alpha/beta hydrolase [Amphibacillus jilinensis]
MDFDLKYDYTSMPKSKALSNGMKVIKGDMKNIRARIEREDIVYQRKSGKNLKIRLIYPDYFQEQRKYPLVFHVQGSAWLEQHLDGHLLDLKDLVTSGYILAIVEYLPLPLGKFPSQVEDAKMAMRYLQAHAEELMIDMDNVFLSGDSSGGHTALLSWATWNQALLDASNHPLPSIKGCIDLYGVVDLVTIADAASAIDHTLSTSPEAQLIGGKIPSQHKDDAAKASVSYYLHEDVQNSPLLIIHGNKDTVVPFEQSVQLHEACKKANKTVEFFCVDNADHGGSVFYCDEVLQVIISFLKKYTNR